MSVNDSDADVASGISPKRHPLAMLQRMLPYPSFRRLLLVRLISQTADGLFQAGVATLVLFSPYHAAAPLDVALAFAVTLLPFTLLVPFVGPLLDRWNRRRILVVGNLVRAVVISLIAVGIVLAPGSRIVFVGALVTLGINRFILAALSAGLPHTLPSRLLVVANSIIPTIGSFAALCGALIGVVLSATLTVAPWQHVTSLILATLCCVGAGLTALTMGRESLGPLEIKLWNFREVIGQLRAGMSHLLQRRTPALALAVMTVQRFIYGISLMMVLLISRNLLADPADPSSGIAVFGVVMAMSFAGNAVAIVATPVAHRKMSSHSWIIVCLLLGVIAQLMLATSYQMPVVLCVFAILGLSVQGAKITIDTIVQRDTDDIFRGRAFSLYDMLFNAAFVAAFLCGAGVLPITGWSVIVCLLCAAGYGVVAVSYAIVVLCLSR